MSTWSWSAEKSSAVVEREVFGSSGLPSNAHPLLPFLIEHTARLGADLALEHELLDYMEGLESKEIETLFKQLSKLPFRSLDSNSLCTDTDHPKLSISKHEIIASNVPAYTPVTLEFEIKSKAKKSILIRQWGQQGPLNGVFSFVSRYFLTLQGKSVDLWHMLVFLEPNIKFRKIHLIEVGENPSIFYPILFDISEERFHAPTTKRLTLSSSGGNSSLRSSGGSSSSSSSTGKKRKETKLGKLPGHDVKKVARSYAWAISLDEISTTCPIAALEDHTIVALYGTLVVLQTWPHISQPGARHWPATYWKTMDWLNDHRHAHLAPRIASSPENVTPYIVYDAPNTLEDLLITLPASHRNFLKIVNILIDVCDALAYLHSVNKTHGRICPWVVSNTTDTGTLLFDYASFERIPPVLKDFASSTPVQPSDAYVAPEAVGTSEFLPTADMFAFGLLIWRLFNDKPPRTQVGEVRNGIIPSFCDTNEFESSGAADIVQDCTKKDPSERPTSSECLERLKAILEKYGGVATKPPQVARRRVGSVSEK